MAVTAIKTEAANMVLMTELNGLLPRFSNTCSVRGSGNLPADKRDSRNNEDCAENAYSR
jgi:hypothetical protein